MLIEILSGPSRLKVGEVYPAARLLSELLGIDASSLTLPLPAADAEGLVAVPVGSSEVGVDLLGITLRAVSAELRIVAPIRLAITVEATLPSPFEGATLVGRLLAEPDRLTLELGAGSEPIDVDVTDNVRLVVPALASVRTEIERNAVALALTTSADELGSAPLLIFPNGRAYLRALSIDAQRVSVRTTAEFEVAGALGLGVEDLELTFTSNTVTLRGHGPATGRFAQAGMRAELSARHLLGRIVGQHVEELQATQGEVSVDLAPLGRLRAAGGFAYQRNAEVPESSELGDRWSFSLDELDLPGPIGPFVPRGSVVLRVWPEYPAFELDATLTGTLPFLGALGPVRAEVSMTQAGIRLALRGVELPALQFGPDLPGLGLGPCDLEVWLAPVISGEVIDEIDGPLEGVTVELRDASDAIVEQGSTVTDAEGHFEFIRPVAKAEQIHVAGRRVTALHGALRGPGLYSVVEFRGSSKVPLSLPAGFPLIESGVFEVDLEWKRGKVLGLTLHECPSVELGPLRLTLTSLAATRRVLAVDDVLLELALTGGGELVLPRLDQPLTVQVDSISAQWRDAGRRELAIRRASVVVPPDVPLLGAAAFTASFDVASEGPGQPLAVSADLELTQLPAAASHAVAGITLGAELPLRVHLEQAAGDAWPSFELESGKLLLSTLPFDLEIRRATFTSESCAVAGQLTLKLDLGPQLKIGPADGALEITEAGWSAAITIDSVEIGIFAEPLEVTSASATVRHEESFDEIAISLGAVEFGPIGELTGASLILKHIREASGARTEVRIQATSTWQHLLTCSLPAVEHLPAFPTEGEVTVRLDLTRTTSPDGYDVALRVEGELERLDRLWPFVPERWRPLVDRAAFVLAVEFADTTLTHALVSAEFDLRLPDLGELPEGVRDCIEFDTGGDDGVVHATLRLEHRAGAQPELAMELRDPLSLHVFLPGMHAEQPSLTLDITRIALALGGGGASAAGQFDLEGRFALRVAEPPSFIPLGAHVRDLIASTGLEVIPGRAKLALAFAGNDCALEFTGSFDDAHLELDVFELLEGLTRSGPSTTGDAIEIPLAAEVAFGLHEIGLRLGRPLAQLGRPAPADEARAAFWLDTHFRFGEIAYGAAEGEPVQVRLELSDRELSLQLERLCIPLSMPLFPFAGVDLQVPGADGALRVLQEPAEWDARDAAWKEELAALRSASESDELEILRVRQRLATLRGIRHYWERIEEPSRAGFLENVRACVDLMRTLTSPLHLDHPIHLELLDVGFQFPFNNPSAAQLDGAVSFGGFPPGTFLAEVAEKLVFGLGLSADQIFFKLETQGTIELPALGPYQGGSIAGRCSFGYGYTRNSFALSVNGNVILPLALVDDLDMPRRLGGGVRLPTHNRFGFRLDLIAVSIGPVDFVIPICDLELDLRAPYSPPFSDISRCEPYWDGFQVHLPGVVHLALKHYACNYFLGCIPAPNAHFDFDLELGDDRSGLRLIVNDLWDMSLAMNGTSYWFGIPCFISPFQSFFDNIAASVQFAGFQVQFDLERPLPRFSPLALFEVLALLADPTFEVEPNGHLANTLRISLRHARIVLPRELQQLFPGAEALEKPLDITLNLGTLIALTQQVYKAVEPVIDVAREGTHELQAALDRIASHPPKFDAAKLLALLPPELRKVRLSGALSGFEAGVVIVLVAPGDARLELARRGEKRPPRPPRRVYEVRRGMSDAEVAALRPVLPDDGRRHFDPGDPSENVFHGIEFEHFDASDFDELPRPADGLLGVVIGAHVTLYRGQRVRFFGCLYDDGSFTLVSSAKTQPLRLQVAGIEARLPLQFEGRLELIGRARRYSTRARVTAKAQLHWDVLPTTGVAVLDVPKARLSLDSSGTFRVSGKGTLALFRGRLTLHGRAEVSESHAFVEGSGELLFGRWNGDKPVLRLSIEGPATSGELDEEPHGTRGARCRLGPGRQLTLSGRGSVELLGQAASSATFEVSERRIAIATTLDSFVFRDPRGASLAMFDAFSLQLRGEIDFARLASPRAQLEGVARLRLGDLELSGRGGVRSDGTNATCYAEGELIWQHCRWAQARIEFGTAGLRLSGHTEFTLDLAPPSPPFGIEFARLVLQLRVAGEFALGVPARSSAGADGATHVDWNLASAELEGAVTLALRLPSGAAGQPSSDHQQVFPLASTSFRGSLAATGSLPLLALRDLTLLPFQVVPGAVSLPSYSIGTGTEELFSFKHQDARRRGDASGLSQMTVWWISAPGQRLVLGVDKPSDFDWWGNEVVAFVVHKPALVAGASIDFSLLASKTANLALELVWSNQGLGVRYTHGSQSHTFALTELLPANRLLAATP